MWWNYIEYIKEKGLAITQNSFCQSVLNFFSNKSQKTLSFNKKVTLKSRNCHKCCLFLLKIIKAIPCITEIQTKVTFFTTNTSFSLFCNACICFSPLENLSNEQFSRMGREVLELHLDTFVFCFFFNWRYWWSPYWSGALNSLGSCKWQCNWNCELQQRKVGFLKTLHWTKWRLYRNNAFALAISTKWIKIFKYHSFVLMVSL